MEKVDLLDKAELIEKTDRSGMLAVVSQTPELLLQAERISAGAVTPAPEGVQQIVISGMGGSAIAGDIAAELVGRTIKVPFLVNRSYNLPEFVGPGTLVFALSYSGDTEEVLSAVREAEKRGTRIIAVASGGKLREIAESKKYPLFLIPAGYQPRAALPFLLIPLLTSLLPTLSEEMKETVSLLKKLREEYSSSRPARLNPAKQLAQKLAGKIPIILGTLGATAAAALRWKTQFNENSKATALVNYFPELNHNELVNLANLERGAHNFALVLLRDEGESERLKKRIAVTKSLISQPAGGVIEITSQGKTPLARLMSLILLGDFVSVYLALLRGVDPTPVEIISRLKKELSR